MQYDCVYIHICTIYSDEREEASKLVEEGEIPRDTTERLHAHVHKHT